MKLEFLKGLKDWVLEQWEIALFLSLFAFFRWLFGKMAQDEGQRALTDFLHNAQAANTYKLLLSGVLNRIDRWFLSTEDHKNLPQTHWRRAWNVKLYDRVLLLAVIYPLTTLYVQWAMTGQEGRLGSLPLLPAGVEWYWRAATTGALMLCFASAYHSLTRQRLVPIRPRDLQDYRLRGLLE